MRSLLVALCAILSAPAAHAQRDAATSELPVREGADAVYIFLPPLGNTAARLITLERSVGDRTHFRPVALPAFATPQARFEEIAGADVLPTLQRSTNAASTAAVYTRLQSEPDPTKWGFAAANIRFLQALGAVAKDGEAARERAGTEVFYRATFSGAGGQTNTTEGSIRLGTPPAITRARAGKLEEADSNITVRWSAPVQGNEEAFSAIVYRRSANRGEFVEAGRVLGARAERATEMTYAFSEAVTPMQNYQYFLVPLTYTGLRGPVSDTVMATARDARRMPPLSLRQALDTNGGIFLSWDAVREARFGAGILIERSTDEKQLYAILDTLPTTATTYTDGRALPGTAYLYRLRYVSARGPLSDPSNSIKAVRDGREMAPQPPTELRTTMTGPVVRLSWTGEASSLVAGYLVYRSPADRDDWQLVSNRVKRVEATDTLRTVASGTYRYRVEAISYADVPSGAGEEETVVWSNPADVPTPPAGLTGYADGARAVLQWRDSRGGTSNILGYHLYARSGAGGTWQRVNDELLTSASATATAGPAMAYAVSSVNTEGLEGSRSEAFLLDASGPDAAPARPSGVSARSTSAGIVVEWGAVLDAGVAGYEVFRRTETDTAPARIGEVPARAEGFTDKTAQKGQLYFYSVAAKGSGREAASARSGEAGARR